MSKFVNLRDLTLSDVTCARDPKSMGIFEMLSHLHRLEKLKLSVHEVDVDDISVRLHLRAFVSPLTYSL